MTSISLLRRSVVLAAVPLAATTVLALAPAQGSTGSTVTATSSVGKLVPGPGLGVSGTRVTLLKLKLPAGTYHVQMPVVVKQSNPDSVDYVDVSLVCKDNYGHADQIGQAVNVPHGTTFTLDPRFYVTFTGTMRGICVGYAQAMRVAGSSTASSSTRPIVVASAKLIVTPASSAARETVRFKGDTAANNHPYTGHSSRAGVGVHFHAAPVNFNVHANAPVSLGVTSSVFLTSCTSTGGSRDATTNGKNLCTSSVVKTGGLGPLVRTRQMFVQYKPDGVTVCRKVVVPNTTTTFRIAPKRHHLPVNIDGTVSLSALAGCGWKAQVYTEVYVSSGPSVVVHFPSTVTSVIPQ